MIFYLVQNVLLYLVVVDVCESSGLFPTHLFHLGPVEQVIWPPYGFGVRVSILRSLPVVGGPYQPRQVGTGFGRFHLAQGFGQHWDPVTLKNNRHTHSLQSCILKKDALQVLTLTFMVGCSLQFSMEVPEDPLSASSSLPEVLRATVL